jgi:hypothetical protein
MLKNTLFMLLTAVNLKLFDENQPFAAIGQVLEKRAKSGYEVASENRPTYTYLLAL